MTPPTSAPPSGSTTPQNSTAPAGAEAPPVNPLRVGQRADLLVALAVDSQPLGELPGVQAAHHAQAPPRRARDLRADGSATLAAQLLERMDGEVVELYEVLELVGGADRPAVQRL